MLDDPLSSLDGQVGKKIFNRVIGPSGVLNKKVCGESFLLRAFKLTQSETFSHKSVDSNSNDEQPELFVAV